MVRMWVKYDADVWPVPGANVGRGVPSPIAMREALAFSPFMSAGEGS